MTNVVAVTWAFDLNKSQILHSCHEGEENNDQAPLRHALGMPLCLMTLAWTLVMVVEESQRWLHVRDYVWVIIWARTMWRWDTVVCINWEDHNLLARMEERYVCALNLSMIDLGTQWQKRKDEDPNRTPFFGNTCWGRKGGEPIAVPYVSFSKSPYHEPHLIKKMELNCQMQGQERALSHQKKEEERKGCFIRYVDLMWSLFLIR